MMGVDSTSWKSKEDTGGMRRANKQAETGVDGTVQENKGQGLT
jgi:hypothetical protein